MFYPLESLECEMDVLSSRFIASLYPLEKKDEVKSYLQKTMERHPKATHYPYAYRILPFEGMGDSGEPKGSTGLPLLEALRQKDADKVLVVVTRYFGGTKLGLPRLTRTYREALSEVLSRSTPSVLVPMLSVHLALPYGDFEVLKKECQRLGLTIKEPKFLMSVELILEGDAKILEPLLSRYENRVKVLSKEMEIVRRKKNESE